MIAGGYKIDVIYKYFSNFKRDYNISIYDTGLDLSTGGRIKKLGNILEDDFLLTYGDGLSNINIDNLIKFHKGSNNFLTVTAVRPPARFGSIEIYDGQVVKFDEKNPQNAGWINGGFFYCNKVVLDYIHNLYEPFEGEPLKYLVSIGKFGAFKHNGWWHPMDTLRDKRVLEELWGNGEAPWRKNA